PGAPPLLYVANAVDGTVTRLDGGTGRVLGPPLPAGPLPAQVVPGPGGGLLVRSFSPQRSGALTYVAPGRGGGSDWGARPVPLEAGARDVWLAGAGGRHAAVAYLAPDPATGQLRCRLALVDALSGTVRPAHDVWGPPGGIGGISGLAVDEGPDGPVAYLGLRQIDGQRPPAGEAVTGRDWLVAVHAATRPLLPPPGLRRPPSPPA